MKKYYMQQLFKRVCYVTLFFITISLSSCGIGKDENIEMPEVTPNETPEETTKKDVFETVAEATQVAGKYFSECNSISELEKHLDEIRNTEGVENAYIDSQTMYVEYDKIGRIIYHYPVYPSHEEQILTRNFDETDVFLSDNIKKQKTRSSDTDEPNKNVHYKLNKSDKHSLVIYNALYADANFESDHIRFEQLKELYNNISCNVKLIEDTNYSCYDFFYKDIFQYDMVILNGHGGYDSSTGNHWFVTGNRFKYSDIDDVQSLKGYTIEEIKYIIESHQNESQYNGAGIAALHEDYISNGKRNTRISYYWEISDERIASIQGQFKERAILFSYACNSLKGNTKFADAFLDKGAACFLGYDNINCISGESGYYFFESLSNGLSAHAAYEYLDKKYQHDTSEYYEPCLNGDYIKNENGLYFESPYNDTNKDDNIIRYRKGNCNAELFCVVHDDEENSYVCITHPVTESYKGNNVLKGSIKIANPNNDNEYGFALYDKKTSKVKKPLITLGKYQQSDNEHFVYDSSTHTLTFTYPISKVQLMDFDKFCAYLFDGERYCKGEDIDLEIKKCPDDNHPHMIDLGLPSGLKWSCIYLDQLYPGGPLYDENSGEYEEIKTTRLEDHHYSDGGLYCWGGSRQKDDSHLTEMVSNDGINGPWHPAFYDIIHLNDISGTQYDTAKIKWGGGWRMPTLAEFNELIENTSWNPYDRSLYGKNSSFIIMDLSFWLSKFKKYELDINIEYWWVNISDNGDNENGPCLGINDMFDYDHVRPVHD